jgi:hypothetical protein
LATTNTQSELLLEYIHKGVSPEGIPTIPHISACPKPGRALPEMAKRRLMVQDENQQAHQAAKVYAAQFQDGSNREHVRGKLKSLQKVAEEFGVHHSKVYRLYTVTHKTV